MQHLSPAARSDGGRLVIRRPAAGPVTVDTPLGPDALAFGSMTGVEALGEPFEYTVDLVGDARKVDARKLFREPMAVHLDLADGETRHFHGHVVSVRCVDSHKPRPTYRAVLRPWFWLLRKTKNCRIFQNKTIRDIVEHVFRDQGFSDFEASLQAEYPPLDYVVQYRESDFDFVSRLLEEAGIYYYFRHAEHAHTLVLADSQAAHSTSPHCVNLPYRSPDEHRERLTEYVDRWEPVQDLTSDAVVLGDFDFRNPRFELRAESLAPASNGHRRFEVFDYPGGFASPEEGDARARVRLEREQAEAEIVEAHTNARGLCAGSHFTLHGHPHDDENREYLVRWSRVTLTGHAQETGATLGGATFSCDLGASRSDVPFRPKGVTPKPVVEGPQTAIVVGPPGDEIWTDEFGRVKVQFPWDREGRRDQNSSCWIRVAQVWAGTNWGAMFIPRIGQEVLVEFLDGDPDRPIVTGRVYNGCNMPPYDLPRSQTQSGIKTRSTTGGTLVNGNEIRFEDHKGSEELFIGAEKTQTTVVKGDQTATVGGSRALSIAGAESVTVGAVRTVQVAGDSFVATGVNKTERVGGSLTTLIGGPRVERLLSSSVTEVAKDSLTRVGGLTRFDLDGALHVTTAGDEARTVGGKLETRIGGPASHVHATDVKTVVGHPEREATLSTFVYGRSSTTASKAYILKSDTSIVLQCGDTKVLIAPDGVTVNGKVLTFNAGDKLTATSPSATLGMDDNVSVVGKRITVSSTGAHLALADEANLTGSQVRLGSASGKGASASSQREKNEPHGKPVYLRTRLLRHGQPASGVAYKLVVDGSLELRGTTTRDGLVEQTVPATAVSALLTFLDTGQTTALAIGEVEPAHTVLGAQARLMRLAFYHGALDGVAGPLTKHAFETFQKARGIAATGQLDGPTRAALKAAYGS